MTKANLYEMFIKPLEDSDVTLDQISELMDPWTEHVCHMYDEDVTPKSEKIFLYKCTMADMNDPDYNKLPNKDTVAAYAYGLSLSLFKE
jgi:hypothetical protein